MSESPIFATPSPFRSPHTPAPETIVVEVVDGRVLVVDVMEVVVVGGRVVVVVDRDGRTFRDRPRAERYK